MRDRETVAYSVNKRFTEAVKAGVMKILDLQNFLIQIREPTYCLMFPFRFISRSFKRSRRLSAWNQPTRQELLTRHSLGLSMSG